MIGLFLPLIIMSALLILLCNSLSKESVCLLPFHTSFCQRTLELKERLALTSRKGLIKTSTGLTNYLPSQAVNL